MLGTSSTATMLTTSSSPSLRPPPYQQPRSSSATYSPTLRSRTPITRSPASAPSPSSRPQHFPIPILQQDVAKSQYADSGTQYSPPDWPPTSSRSTLRVARLTTKTDGANDQEPKSAAERAAPKSPANTTPYGPPPEPRVRVTPQTSLHNMGGPLRRNRSSLSSRDASPNPDQSSPKRVRQQNANAKVMPIHYTSCEPKDLAALVADMLLELIHYNDEIPLVDGHLTRFHSRFDDLLSGIHLSANEVSEHRLAYPCAITCSVSHSTPLFHPQSCYPWCTSSTNSASCTPHSPSTASPFTDSSSRQPRSPRKASATVSGQTAPTPESEV